MAETTKQKSTVFVGGLDMQVTSQTLHDAFIPFGEIVDVALPKPELYVLTQPSKNIKMLIHLRPSNRDPHRGFGYVEFSLAEDAREAIDNMDQAELYGRVIKVNQAKPQKNAGEGLGSRTAIWEQEGYASKYNVNEEQIDSEANGGPDDPVSVLRWPLCYARTASLTLSSQMQGLEGLDEAGPKQQ